MATGRPARLARFGAEVFRFSPRPVRLMIVAGRIVMKMLPVLQRIWQQMPEPKWCISMAPAPRPAACSTPIAWCKGSTALFRWTCTRPAVRRGRSNSSSRSSTCKRDSVRRDIFGASSKPPPAATKRALQDHRSKGESDGQPASHRSQPPRRVVFDARGQASWIPTGRRGRATGSKRSTVQATSRRLRPQAKAKYP